MHIRPITLEDAAPVSTMLKRLTALGKRTLPDDPVFVRNQYITNDDILQCVVAVDDADETLGLQVLKLAVPGNVYGTTPGWGIIGTHVSPDAARTGIGRALFDHTLRAARLAKLPMIEAGITLTNAEGLAYYEAIGFRDHSWRREGRVCKCFDLRA